MDIPSLVLFAGLLVFAAHLFAWVFSFTKIPDVLLLLLVGVALGPVFGILSPTFFGESGVLFSTIVLAIMLFHSGSSLRIDVIRASWQSSMQLMLGNFLLAMVTVAVVLYLASGLPFIVSLMVGAMIGGTSSVVVIPLARQLAMSDKAQTIALLESAMTDILSIVITIALLATYESGAFDILDVIVDIVVSFLGASVLGIVAGVVWSVLLNKVRQISNPIFLTPSFVLVLFGIAEAVGFSGPITALAFGITMGNIIFFALYLNREHVVWHSLLHPLTLSQEERSFFDELVFVLQTFFFVFVGTSITVTSTMSVWIALGITLLIFAIRIPIVRYATPKTLLVFDRAQLAAMVPKGMATAVLATLIVSRGVAGAPFIQEVAYIVILASVVLTSLLVFLIHKTAVAKLYGRMVGMPAGDTVPPAHSPEG